MKHVDRANLGLKRLLNSLLLKYYSRQGVFPIEIRSTVGLGARLTWCLEIMAYCDENGLLPQFRFSYANSEESGDYFGRCFRIKGAQAAPARFVTISSIIELNLGKHYNDVLNLSLASYLVDKYLVINEDVMDEVENFCSRHFSNRRVLGVHYRGADKAREAPVVPYVAVRNNVERYLENYPETDCVFIATDDARFLEDLEAAPISRPVVYRNDSLRSDDGQAIHEASHTNKYEVNRDALVNCLILSRCDALMKAASILSGWSKLFNPQLPVMMLNKPYDEYLWFPERDLVEDSFAARITSESSWSMQTRPASTEPLSAAHMERRRW
jgi:hypothetical protein